MAKQNGLFRIAGTLDDMTFYKSSQFGFLLRNKGGVTAERIATDPAFDRTRENGMEFGNAAKAGKLLRDSFNVILKQAADRIMTSRLTKLMAQIKNLDATHTRGNRTVATGLATAAGKELLNGFSFNMNGDLSRTLHANFSVDLVGFDTELLDFVPGNDLTAPPDATHFSMQAGYAIIDFATGENSVEYSNIYNSLIDLTPVDINLVPATLPTGTGIKIAVLTVTFFQEVNGLQYRLNNEAFTPLAIVAVG